MGSLFPTSEPHATPRRGLLSCFSLPPSSVPSLVHMTPLSASYGTSAYDPLGPHEFRRVHTEVGNISLGQHTLAAMRTVVGARGVCPPD